MEDRGEMEIIPAMLRVFVWAKTKDFKGHDPHDLLESPIFGKLAESKAELAKLVVLQLGRRSSLNLHSWLRVPERENPKALALFISGLTRTKATATDDWLNIAEQLAERLLKISDIAWGYPFAWQSRTHFVARDAPTIVATSFVAQALLDLFEITREPNLLATAERSAKWILASIPRFEVGEELAFGYGPNDPQIVFNASLLGAELIARVGEKNQDAAMIALAKRAAEFVVSHQRPDGAWVYGLEASQTWVDGFHTGFVLTSLKRIATLTNDDNLHQSAKLGFEYFRKELITKEGLPKYFNNSLYPIDAHSAGQAILTLSKFGDLETAKLVAMSVIQLLQSPEGYFYYQAHKTYINKVPYMRWSNAWMFRGLAEIA